MNDPMDDLMDLAASGISAPSRWDISALRFVYRWGARGAWTFHLKPDLTERLRRFGLVDIWINYEHQKIEVATLTARGYQLLLEHYPETALDPNPDPRA